MAKITMSLNQIKSYNPCAEGFKKLLKSRGGSLANYDEQIPLLDILESNGIKDTIWCFRINWTAYKNVYMQFVSNCVKRANNYAATASDSAAVYAADAADAATDAAYYADAADTYHVSAYYASAAAADYADTAADAAADAASHAVYASIERQKQHQDLTDIIKFFESSNYKG